MDNRRWVAALYPAGITLFAVLCQFTVYIPDGKDRTSCDIGKSRRMITHTGDDIVVLQEQDDGEAPSQLRPEACNPQTHLLKESTLRFAAFWLILQYYSLLRMGSKTKLAEQEQRGFVWAAMVALFLPTAVVGISTVKLADAIEILEVHRRLSNETSEWSIPSVGLVGFSLLLLPVPWVQAIYILVW